MTHHRTPDPFGGRATPLGTPMYASAAEKQAHETGQANRLAALGRREVESGCIDGGKITLLLAETLYRRAGRPEAADAVRADIIALRRT